MSGDSGFTLGDLSRMKSREDQEEKKVDRVMASFLMVEPEDVATLAKELAISGQPSAHVTGAPSMRSGVSVLDRRSRYEEEKQNPRARRVRSPRFSDEEWERVTRQAARMPSQAVGPWGFSIRKGMTALELVRVATMACVKLLEDVPHGAKPPKLWDVLDDPTFRGALTARMSQLEKAEHAARWGSARASSTRNAQRQAPAAASSRPKPKKKQTPPQPKKKRSSR